MRKFCFSVYVISIILLMVNFSFAQSPRQPTSSEGKTTYTNIGLTGLDNNGDGTKQNPGTPAYIGLTNGSGNVFYLWVGTDSQLRIASEQVVGYLASPATVGWQDSSGVIVGTQHSAGGE